MAVVYSPVLFFNYVFHDDASLWIKLKEYGFKHIFFDTCMSQCRYGDALLLNLENTFVHKVSDLRFLRFLSLVISSCSALFLLQQMRRMSFRDIQAYLIISAMFFLPGFADIILYGISSSIFTFCILLACWSFHQLQTSKGMIVPVFSFLLAITIYPPAAMFYWTMVGMNVLFTRDRSSKVFRNNLWRFMGAGAAGLLIYGFSVFFMHYYFAHKMANPLYNPYEIASNWPNKFQWFFREPLNNALNLWDIFPKAGTSIFVIGFIGFTALFAIIKRFKQVAPQQRKDTVLTYTWQLGLFMGVFFLTFLPNLAAQGNAAFYHCLVPLTSLVWLILVWAILKWTDFLPTIFNRWGLIALLSIIVVSAGVTTFNNVLHDRVLPSTVEWTAYKTMAEEVRFKKINAIHVILPFHHLSRERYDEFGVLTSHYSFDIYPMVRCAFNEAGWQGQKFPLIYFSYPEDPLLIESNEILIKKMPDGKWVGKDINRAEGFHEINGSLFGHSLDRALFYNYSPAPIALKKQNWYVLDLNDFFGPSNERSRINPDLAQAYNIRGSIYFKHGNFTQALSDFTKAVGFNPDSEEAFYNLGLTYYRLKKYDKAKGDWRVTAKVN